MKYSIMRGHLADVTAKGNLKKRAAQALSGVTQPPPTPARVNTGLDANGFASGDRQGNVYLMHSGKPMGLRSLRRAMRFGNRGGVKPLRSRIQRQSRKRRTGGVK